VKNSKGIERIDCITISCLSPLSAFSPLTTCYKSHTDLKKWFSASVIAGELSFSGVWIYCRKIQGDESCETRPLEDLLISSADLIFRVRGIPVNLTYD